MKRKLLIALMMLTLSWANAQFQNIDDPVFEDELIRLGHDTNPIRDGQILISDAQAVTFLNLTGDQIYNANQNEIGLGITNLTGIKAFTNLDVLWVQGNQLIELDLEGMSTLTDVRAFFNELETINIKGLSNLEIIGLNVNNITGINVSTNTNLRVFDIAQNNLFALDVRGLTALESTNFQDNTQLNCVLVENADTANTYNNNVAFRRNGTAIFSNSCPNIYTLIPDSNFEQSLLDQGYDSEGGITNGLVLTSDVATLVSLDVTNRNISDLTGLEAFSALESLFASENDITSIDVSNNISLTVLDLALNNLSSIDLSQNTNLEQLFIYRNNLTSLDVTNNTLLTFLNAEFMNLATLNVTQNTLLEDLFLSSTNLSSIDISQNTELRGLLLGSNNLTSIDVSIHSNLNTLYVNSNDLANLDLSQNPLLSIFQAQGNANLSCIKVDDIAAAEAQFNWQKDLAAIYSTNCGGAEKIVEVSVISGQGQDIEGNYVITSAGQPIQLGFNLIDENNNELDASILPNYMVNITTVESTTENPAHGGNVTTPGVDFELLTNEPLQINTINNSIDGNWTIALQGDQLFEADEFFFIEVRTTDTNIALKNAENGVVQIPVKIVDNEVTNINLEWVRNGAEPNQNAKLKITSSLQNDTGAPMPFVISLSGGDAVIGEDYQDLATQPAIPNGASSIEFDITILNNDVIPENEENFFANMNYTGALPNERVIIQNGSQEVTITDDGDASNNSFTVSASITEAIGSGSNFEIEEGQSFQLNFDTGNTGTNGNIYNPIISITMDGFGSNEDFDIDDLDKSFTIGTSNPDGSIVFTARDDGQEEDAEKYVISISSEKTNLYTIAEPTSFEVTIQRSEGNPEYSGESFTFNITPKGDVTGNEANNNLQIEEGKILELWVDAQTPNQADSYSFQLEPLFDPKFKDDIEILENPRITVDNSKNPDGIIKIRIKEDMIVDEDELIGLIFRSKPYFSYTNLYNFNDDKFRYIPFTVKNVSTAEYYLTWDNKGSLEGGDNEEILIQLKNKNGTPYTAESDLVFDIAFDTSVGNNIPTADVGEYPTNKTVTIEAGQSTFTLRYPVPNDITADKEAEYYRAVISKSENNSINIELPDLLIIKILDKENKYMIFAQPFTKQSTNRKYFSSQTSYSNGGQCCNRYTIQEGSNYTVGFEAEKGVPLGLENSYTINATYSYDKRGTSGDEAPKAENLKDFQNVDKDNSSNYWPQNPKNPDNRLLVEIFDDKEEIDLGLDPNEIDEKFDINITLGAESDEKFVLRSVNISNPASFLYEGTPASPSVLSMDLPFRNTDIFIKQVVPISLETLDGAINEENYESDFAKIKIKRPDNGTGFFDEVNLFVLANSPNTDALEGVDFEPIQKTIIFGSDFEKEILIKALPDDIVDNGEQIKIRIAPGNGYSFDEDNIVTVTISDEDVGEFDASIEVPEDSKRLFEDITLGPANGVFEITLLNDQNKTPDEDIKVYFTLNDLNGQPQEGIDYRIFEGQGNEKREITNTTEKYVTIKQGEIKGIITIEVVQNDGIVESPESITIQLTSGIGYNLSTNAKEDTITIISKEEDTSELDPSDITAIVTSGSCPGVDEGKIALANSSPFDFTVNLYSSSNTNEILYSKSLRRNTIEPVELFEKLEAGDYEIKITIDSRPDILPPTFNVSVRNNLGSTQLLSYAVDSELKMANLVVSGSKFYQIESNENIHSFKFDTYGPNKLQLPIKNGKNKIIINGEASCQGKIQTELFLADYKVYPNPTKSTVSFIGFVPLSPIKMYLFDATGRLAVSHETTINSSGNFEVNVDFLPDGTYFGKILSDNKELLKMKLIKN